jgi:hypothetical protein
VHKETKAGREFRNLDLNLEGLRVASTLYPHYKETKNQGGELRYHIGSYPKRVVRP